MGTDRPIGRAARRERHREIGERAKRGRRGKGEWDTERTETTRSTPRPPGEHLRDTGSTPGGHRED